MSSAESDGSYPGAIPILNSGWRVIICRHRIRWICSTAIEQRPLQDTFGVAGHCQSRPTKSFRGRKYED
jgi:hypothetical protein